MNAHEPARLGDHVEVDIVAPGGPASSTHIGTLVGFCTGPGPEPTVNVAPDPAAREVLNEVDPGLGDYVLDELRGHMPCVQPEHLRVTRRLAPRLQPR